MTGRRALRWLLAIALVVVTASRPLPAAASTDAVAPDQQILVMVQHPPDGSNAGYAGGYGNDVTRSARERLARSIAKAHGLTLVDAWPMPMIGLDCLVMAVPTGRSTTAAADEVSKDAEVQWAQPVAMYETQSASSDPLYPTQPAVRQWRLTDLHQMSTGRGIKVAVIDSGIETNHPDLTGQIAVNRNFVAGRPAESEQHGTGVAGIIAAKADNGVGIMGVAPGAKILGLRACWQVGDQRTVCDSFSVIKALYFAIQEKADVINMSLSGPDDRLLLQLIDKAMERGSAVVAAYDRRRPGGGFPASVMGVVSVSDSPVAPKSLRVYTAPGRDVPTTQPGDRWFLVNGSSFAAAHVSGLVALLRQGHRSASPTLVSGQSGAIDACASLVRMSGGCDCSCARARTATASR